jgi:hypothetical protein
VGIPNLFTIAFPDGAPAPRILQKGRGDLPQGVTFFYLVGIRRSLQKLATSLGDCLRNQNDQKQDGGCAKLFHQISLLFVTIETELAITEFVVDFART